MVSRRSNWLDWPGCVERRLAIRQTATESAAPPILNGGRHRGASTLHVAGLSHMSAAAILSVVGIRFRAGSSHLTIRNCRSFRQAVANRQLTGGKLWDMAKKTAASEPQERPYKTTGVHLPADLWELLNRVAFERARTRGGRASVSALLVEMIERNRKALELELGKTVR